MGINASTYVASEFDIQSGKYQIASHIYVIPRIVVSDPTKQEELDNRALTQDGGPSTCLRLQLLELDGDYEPVDATKTLRLDLKMGPITKVRPCDEINGDLDDGMVELGSEGAYAVPGSYAPSKNGKFGFFMSSLQTAAAAAGVELVLAEDNFDASPIDGLKIEIRKIEQEPVKLKKPRTDEKEPGKWYQYEVISVMPPDAPVKKAPAKKGAAAKPTAAAPAAPANAAPAKPAAKTKATPPPPPPPAEEPAENPYEGVDPEEIASNIVSEVQAALTNQGRSATPVLIKVNAASLVNERLADQPEVRAAVLAFVTNLTWLKALLA